MNEQKIHNYKFRNKRMPIYFFTLHCCFSILQCVVRDIICFFPTIIENRIQKFCVSFR